MRAGALKHRLVVVRLTAGAPNAFNESVPGWVDQLSVACSRDDVSDAERTRAAGRGEMLTTRFVIRNTSEARLIKPSDRLLCDGRLYDIASIKRVDNDQGLEVGANATTETVAAGDEDDG